jgi:hypothetical protein
MILLDTPIWVNWILLGSEALKPAIASAIEDADRVAISAISKLPRAFRIFVDGVVKMTDIAIKIQNLSKSYHIYDNPIDRFKPFFVMHLRWSTECV